jgi:hypothetical protein
VADQALFATAQLQADLGQLGGLAGAGLAADDDDLMAAQASAISWRRPETGSSSGKVIGGSGLRGGARRGAARRGAASRPAALRSLRGRSCCGFFCGWRGRGGGCFGNGHEADIIPATARPVRLQAAGGPMVRLCRRLAAIARLQHPARNLAAGGAQAYAQRRRWL